MEILILRVSREGAGWRRPKDCTKGRPRWKWIHLGAQHYCASCPLHSFTLSRKRLGSTFSPAGQPANTLEAHWSRKEQYTYETDHLRMRAKEGFEWWGQYAGYCTSQTKQSCKRGLGGRGAWLTKEALWLIIDSKTTGSWSTDVPCIFAEFNCSLGGHNFNFNTLVHEFPE